MHKPAIGLPVSQHFDAVFGPLSEIVDTLVIRDTASLPGECSRAYRKSYHTSGFINREFAERMTDDFLGTLLKEGVTQMSFDCGPSCLDVCLNSKKNDIYWPQNPAAVLKPDEIVAVAKERIASIRSRFSGVLALENLDYHKGGAYEHVCDPVFISDMIRELGVYFALDIGHLLVSCFNLGMRPEEYLDRLPLELLKEVHLSHPEGDNDKHECPTSREYAILDRALECGKPEFVVIEYYFDPVRIVEANRELHKYLNRHA